MRPGIVISFEGISCAGKTTVLAETEAFLRSRGVPVRVKTDLLDYQGEHIGAQIRSILAVGAPSFRLGYPVVETLLICAKRAFEAQERLEPALGKGAVILCDRDIDTVCAYQLAVLAEYRPFDDLGIMTDWIRLTNYFACPEPDLTFYLEVSPGESLRRCEQRDAASLENTPPEEFIKQRERELQLFKSVLARPIPGRSLHRIPTESRGVSDVSAEIQQHVSDLLRSRGYRL